MPHNSIPFSLKKKKDIPNNSIFGKNNVPKNFTQNLQNFPYRSRQTNLLEKIKEKAYKGKKNPIPKKDEKIDSKNNNKKLEKKEDIIKIKKNEGKIKSEEKINLEEKEQKIIPNSEKKDSNEEDEEGEEIEDEKDDEINFINKVASIDIKPNIMQRHYYTNSNFSLNSNNSSRSNKSNIKDFCNTESDDSYAKSFVFGPHSGRSNYSGNTPLTTMSSQGNKTERSFQFPPSNKLCFPALFGPSLNMSNSIIQNNQQLMSSFLSNETINNNYTGKRYNTSNSNENSSNIFNNRQLMIQINNNMIPRHMYSNSELIYREPFSLNMSAINLYKNNNCQNQPNKNQIIDLEKVALGIEKRTTIMIRNLPMKYRVDLLEKDLSSFKGKFDCIYMPFDYENGANKGYAFINLVNPYHILLLYEQFKGKSWKLYESKKICELNFAKFQGIEEIKKNANNYKGNKRPTFYDNENCKVDIEVPKRYLNLILEKFPKLKYHENIEANTIIIQTFE